MKTLLPLFLLIWLSLQAGAQGDIPLGTWRTHFSYASVQELALAGNRVYAATNNGFFYVDKAANEVTTLGPLQGFSDVGVSVLAWQEQQQLLLIGYRNGNIDLLQNGKVTNISTIRTAALEGSKTLREVVFRGDSALIATDYGISVVNISQGRLLDTYLNLGPQGQRVSVYDLAVLNDTLYAATSAGLISNRLSASINLGYFGSWQRWGASNNLPSSGIKEVEKAGQQLWVAGPAGQLFKKSGNSWIAIPLPFQEELRDLAANKAGNALIISTTSAVYRYQIQDNTFSEQAGSLLADVQTAVENTDGTFWIADAYNGLLTSNGATIERRSPEGPLYDLVQDLEYANGQLIALYGGGGAQDAPLGTQGFSVFSPATGWINYHPQQRAGSRSMPPLQDIAAAAYHPDRKEWYLASYASGLLRWEPREDVFSSFTLASPGVSFTSAINYPGRVLLSDVGVDATGNVWMSSYNSNRPLHRYNPVDNSWQAYLENNFLASLAQELVIPFTGDIWLRLHPEKSETEGILVFNPQKQPSRRQFSRTSGNGGLASNLVYALEEDRDGILWVGTDDGASYFPNPGAVLTDNAVDAALPIFQQRPLLDESLVTSIAIDGGNRKWMGTNDGLWVFGDAGDTLYHHFTTANSPLPSNVIKSIGIHQQTGEVFVATDKGLVSYRSGSTQGDVKHASAIKIFPNPVRPGFNGTVGITGLVQDAIVKITDTAGFLVRELQAQGGTAAWDLQDSRGRSVASGVYLVFSADATGTEALAGKIAVVR